MNNEQQTVGEKTLIGIIIATIFTACILGGLLS